MAVATATNNDTDIEPKNKKSFQEVGEYIDYYISPSYNGFFPDRVKLDYKFSINNSVWQIRIDQDATDAQSYAGLYRFSKTGDWTTIAARKPFSDYGIRVTRKPYDETIYDVILDDLAEIADVFEKALNSES